jgi:hypothetical protein
MMVSEATSPVRNWLHTKTNPPGIRNPLREKLNLVWELLDTAN